VIPPVDSILVAFALAREAAPFRQAIRGRGKIDIAITGVGPVRARTAIEELLATRTHPLVVSAGFCGALQPGLAVGDVYGPSEVIDVHGTVWKCEFHEHQAGRLLTTNAIVASPAEKRALGERTGALIVDMESAAIARACAAKAIPFISVRAVSDTVDTGLSPDVVRLLADGRVSIWKAIRVLIRKPSLIGEFQRLARSTDLAARNLCAGLLEIVSQRQKA
jgi:adenosylhomocysteine nucleosidase